MGFSRACSRQKCREADAELASRRSDKPNPLYYAQRTVDVASARLWLIEGIRIDGRDDDARIPTPLRASRRTLLRSCAGDCDYSTAHGQEGKRCDPDK